MPAPIFGPTDVDQNPGAVSLGGPSGPGFWDSYFANGSVAPNRAPVGYDTTNADQAHGWQQQLMQDLQRRAAGDPDSRAQQGLTSAYAQARAGQSALGSGMRGTGGGAGLRAGMMGAGNVQRGYAGDSAMLMVQEKQAAQALLAQQLAQQRTQDMQQAQGIATNTLGNQSLEDQMRQFFSGGSLNTGIAGAQRGVDQARAQAGITDAQRALGSDILNSSLQAGGTAAGAAANWARGGKKDAPYSASDSDHG